MSWNVEKSFGRKTGEAQKVDKHDESANSGVYGEAARRIAVNGFTRSCTLGHEACV